MGGVSWETYCHSNVRSRSPKGADSLRPRIMRRRRGRGNTSWARGGSWRLVARTAWSVGHDRSAGGDDPRPTTANRHGQQVIEEVGPADRGAVAGVPIRCLDRSAERDGGRNGQPAPGQCCPASSSNAPESRRRRHGRRNRRALDHRAPQGVHVQPLLSDMSDRGQSGFGDLLRQLGLPWAGGGAGGSNHRRGRQVEAPARCCLITTADSRRNPGVRAFREWILKEA